MTNELSLGRKLVLGLVVSTVFLVVALGLLEIALRVGGYGQSPCFFRKVKDDGGNTWVRENRSVTAPYFPPELIRRPQPMRLAHPKPANAYRIFVLGSSAAMGDPEASFSLSRQLELLLRTAYPEIPFEVVNAGITAINSHVVRAIAQDCAKLQPDLFVVYEGNNEVIGPYGPATVFTPFLGSSAAIRMGQAIKSTRMGQLASSFARRASPASDLSDWGGMRMFLKNEIAADDPRLERTRALFRDNLEAIAEAGRDADADVLLCTVLTNLKDFAPFRSAHRATLSDADKQRWQEAFEAGQRAFAAGRDDLAEADFRRALAIDDQFAELHFRLGRVCLRQDRAAEARAFFQRALDLDLLRFRTDSRLNQIIRDVATQGREGVQLVDLTVAAARESPHGIPGDELLYEHVHMNFQGTYLMARELFARVTELLIRDGRIATRPDAASIVSLQEARRRLAYTVYEQAMIIGELQSRFGGAPFTAQSDNDARLKLYAARAETATRLLTRAETRNDVVTHYEQAIAQAPSDWVLRRNAGMAFVALGLPERARVLLEEAAAVIDDDPDTLFALARAQASLGDVGAAEKTVSALRTLEPRYPGLPPAKP